VRAAQSLGERTGLSLQYTWRTVFGSVPPVVVSTPALFFEDGVYDDPYASDASAARAKPSSPLLPSARCSSRWGAVKPGPASAR